MQATSFAASYLDAWNQRDFEHLIQGFFGIDERSVYCDSNRNAHVYGAQVASYISDVMTLGNIRYELLDFGFTGGNRAAVQWRATGDGLHLLCPLLVAGTLDYLDGLDYLTLDQGRITTSHIYFDLLPHLQASHKAGERPAQYSKSGLRVEVAREKLQLLHQLMAEEGLYLDAGVSATKVARQLGMHTNHLSQAINSQAGVSFNDYINNFRIQHAKRLLDRSEVHDDCSVVAIAFDSGFGSVSAFYRVFAKHVGMTPLQYRKRGR
jgi:AraC-like DNA-binding protein